MTPARLCFQQCRERKPGQPCRIHAYTVYTHTGGKGRCRTRGESEGSVVHRRGSMQARESTLALKPRADVTRSPKQGYQWPHETDMCPTKKKCFQQCLSNKGISGSKFFHFKLYLKLIKSVKLFCYRYL